MKSVQIEIAPKLPPRKYVESACEGMAHYCHKYGGIYISQKAANELKKDISKIMTPIKERGYSFAFESECLQYLGDILNNETVVVDCLECARDFRTTAKKQIGEKFQCEHCGHPMEAESDYGEDGEIIWYAKGDTSSGAES